MLDTLYGMPQKRKRVIEPKPRKVKPIVMIRNMDADVWNLTIKVCDKDHLNIPVANYVREALISKLERDGYLR